MSAAGGCLPDDKRVAGLCVVEFAEGDRLAGGGLRTLLEMLAHQLENTRYAPAVACRRHQGRAVAGLAGEQPHDRHLAAVRRVERLEHERRRVVARFDAQTLRRFGRAGRFMPECLEQAQDAVAARGDTEKNRADDAFAQFLREIVEHLVARRLDILEQLLHQLVVVVGKRLEHLEARFFLAVEVFVLQLDDFGRRVFFVDKGALEREIDKPGDDVAVPDRNLPQQQRHARGRLQELDRFANALVGLVDLVEENEARNVLVFQLAQDQLQLRHLLLVRFADNDGRVDGRQHAAHILDEFDRTRAVHKGVVVAHEVGGGERGFHAHLVMPRLLAWSRRSWCLHRLCPGAGSRQSGRELLLRSVVLPLWKGPTSAMHRGPRLLVPLGPLSFCPIIASLAGREVGPGFPALSQYRLRTRGGWQEGDSSLRKNPYLTKLGSTTSRALTVLSIGPCRTRRSAARCRRYRVAPAGR